MEIVNKKINEITPYEKNPRNNDEAVKYVLNSIKEFGFKVPIIIDKDGIIVAGHTRYKAAIELGMSEVPTIIADDLTEEQIKAYRLADNKVSEKAQWDFELLDDELKGLELSMEDFGFENIDINLDIDDSQFVQDTEITKNKNEKKEIICPNCGEKIEI